MRKFEIVQKSIEVVTRVFEVEAETEEEAIQLIEDGEVDEYDSTIEVDNIEYYVGI